MSIEKPLDVPALAGLLGVSVDWVYTQVEAGAIPHTRLPSSSRTGARRLIRFTAAHVAAILADGDRPVVTVPAISLARARAIRSQRAANNPPPTTPPTEPRTPATPPKPGPATPRPPSGPGRAQAGAA